MKIDERELVALIRSANPVLTEDALLDSAEESRSFLHAVELKRDAMPEAPVAGLERPPERPKRARVLRPAIAIATIAAAVVLGLALWLASSSEDTAPVDQPPPDPISVVEDLFAAWNAGDVETFIALQSEEAIGFAPGQQVQEETARDAFLFQYMLGAEWVLTDCESPPATGYQGDVVFCRLTVSTDLTRTYGLEHPGLSRVRFVVDDGIINFQSFNPFLVSPSNHSLFLAATWLFDNYEAEATEACGGLSEEWPDYATPRCAEFVQLHLDEWKAYLEAEGAQP
ncbi:MAG: hypothetical protein ACE5MI_11690 [Acidimicrobiia bacterium]